MTKSFYLIFVFAFTLVTNIFGQKPSIELTFTAQYHTQYVMLDSIYIENVTQGGDTMLYAPDTVLVLDYTVGVAANLALNTGFRVLQNRPNPFTEQTIISIFLPEADHLQVSVVNLLGQKVAFFERSLDAGSHSFVFYPGDDKYYILTATASGLAKTIKMVSLNNHSSKQVLLNYQGPDETQAGFKSTQETNDFGYSLGDQLRFTGFAKNPSDIAGSDVIEATPEENENYVFEIIEGIPCPGTPTVTYEGQTYNTVQIGTQCWFKENLNVGTMIPGSQEMTNNNIIEKYCYDDDPANCATYGGLYAWDEMMQYTTQQGTQGICPEGWHIPTDAEWCTLTQFIDPSVNCDTTGWSGTDVGTKMKSTTGWNSGGNGTNASGFTALPGGARYYTGYFDSLGDGALFWSSTELNTNYAWSRYLGYSKTNVYRRDYGKTLGFSVRCVQDTQQMAIPCPGTPTVTYEGQTYNTVQIGDQCWLKENLNVGTMISGNQEMTNNSIIEKYCYNDNTANCDTYGGLYQWNEMMQYTTQQGTQGICPEGWHLPTDAEWTLLISFLGGESIAGGKIKTTGTIEAGTGLWYTPNTGATNETGFSALPGGYCYGTGDFYSMGYDAHLWSSTEWDTYYEYSLSLNYNSTNGTTTVDYEIMGYSSRCVQDTQQMAIPCPGTPTVTYEGQTYNTVKIGTQCWFKENLNVGTMIPGNQEMTNNSIIEKYCYNDNSADCDSYGGLYQWNEMMQYTSLQGTQGICPAGWHLPTDDEWTVLTDFLGGEYVAGGKMKSTGTIGAGTGLWYDPNEGATNESGFSGLPGGYRPNGYFYDVGYSGYCWSSTESSSPGAWKRSLNYAYADVYRGSDDKEYGFSVRCLRDN